MAFFEFPHTRTYDSDLGWLIKTVTEIYTEYNSLIDWKNAHIEEYNELNAKVDGLLDTLVQPVIPWTSEAEYKIYSIVSYNSDNYIAIQDVPAGIMITNTDYWIMANTAVEQINAISQSVSDINDTIDEIKRTSLTIVDKIKTNYAHRGWGWNSGQPVPQNSLPAYYAAKSQGFGGIEVDIQYDLNQEIVCIHDMNISTLTDQTGYMRQHARTDVHLKLPNGTVSTYNPPLLKEVIQLCKSCGMALNIEFKYDSNNPMVNVDDVLDLLALYNFDAFMLNIAPISLLSDVKYKTVYKVINDYASIGITEDQAQYLSDVYGNVIIYLNAGTLATDAVGYVAAAHAGNCLVLGATTTPEADATTYAGICDMYLTETAALRMSTTRIITPWYPCVGEGSVQPATTGTYIAQYRKVGNMVQLRGRFDNITSVPCDITRMPVGFRPLARSAFSCMTASGTPEIMDVRVNDNDGMVYLQRTGYASPTFPLAVLMSIDFETPS